MINTTENCYCQECEWNVKDSVIVNCRNAALFSCKDSFTQSGNLFTTQESPHEPAFVKSDILFEASVQSHFRVPSVRLCDRFAPRGLGSASTKRSGDSNEIEPVILVGY